MSRHLSVILNLTILTGLSQAHAKEPIAVSVNADFSAENPFSQPSELPLKTLDFKAYQSEHFQPAMIAGMKQQLAEISVITANKQPATFENTIVPLEKSGQLLNRAQSAFGSLTSAHTSDALQNIQSEMAPLLAAHSDNILLDRKLFQRLKDIFDSQGTRNLTEEQQQVLKQYYEDSLRAGANLSDQQQARIRVLNEQLSTLETKFEDNLLAVMKERSVIVDDVAELDGLSEAEISSAAEKATERGHSDKYLLEISNTTRVPVLASLKNRSLRERVWRASAERALGKEGGIDNRGLILEVAALRAEKAKLLGFANYATYKLSDQMAKNPTAALKMLTDLVPGVVARVNEEAADLRAAIQASGSDHELEAWDWEYYSEKVRAEKFDVDESAVRPYFELDNVLQKGVFHTMNLLFGITFKERTDLPIYHPDVRTFDVLDADDSVVGLFYFDPFKRDTKRGGAWMNAFVGQTELLRQQPVIVNVLNIPKPADGEPALISLDNVTTLFHEMGHAVHGLFSDVTYPSVAGTATPSDFVEFPSTFEEDWAIQPEILKNYAVHYKTGEPIPQELLGKVIAASKFNQGFDTLEYMSAAILDLEWHLLTEDDLPSDIDEFEAAILKKHGIDLPAVPPRYRTAYFAHIWGGGYSASYYAYLWSEVLAADAFAFLLEQGGATRKNGDLIRAEVLSRGSSRPPMNSYEAFRGQQPSVDALLIRRGLK